MTMLDRMARAMFAVTGRETGLTWEQYEAHEPQAAQWFRNMARAAAEEMREPSEAMHAAAAEIDMMAYPHGDPVHSYQTLIRAALEERTDAELQQHIADLTRQRDAAKHTLHFGSGGDEIEIAERELRDLNRKLARAQEQAKKRRD